MDPEISSRLGKVVRLWLLSSLCAGAGATGVYLTDSIPVGVTVFLAFLTVFGTALLAYERRRQQ